MEQTNNDIVYVIDAADILVKVNLGWDNFAEANEGITIYSNHIVGKSLWSYITGKDTQKIYQELLALVRQKQKPITLPYRCDSPELRRFMSMTITPLENKAVQFSNHTLKTVPRPPHHFKLSKLYEGQAIILRCSLCNRLKVKSAFLELEEALDKGELLNDNKPIIITYTVCQECSDHILEKQLFYQQLNRDLAILREGMN